MRLITSSEQLDALLPNIQVTVTGETPLMEKMAPFLSATEKWLSDVFTGETVFVTICSLAEEDSLRATTTQAVVYEAFRRAVPHLDIILTPNGFGIVSNTNIAPASKERINRLLDALLENRDAALMQVQALLCSNSEWLASSQALFFRTTMFPNMEVTLRLPRLSEGRWMLYLSIREKAIVIEQFLDALAPRRDCSRGASLRSTYQWN